MGRPVPDDEIAVPNEFVPGDAALVPNAPPVTGIDENPDMWPIPPRPNAAVVDKPMTRATHAIDAVFMAKLL